MARLGGAEVTERVRRVVRERAGEWGLDPKRADVRYVLNLGGFGNSSFHLTDGATKLHLKLCRTDEDERALRRWDAVGSVLAERYHAPRLLEWVAVPETDYRGVLFEHVEGETLDETRAATIVPRICEMLGRLHEDQELTERIGSATPPRTYRDCFRMRFEKMFAEDLAAVRADRPPFVSGQTLEFLEAESQRVLRLAGHPAFDAYARSPCHWDLWSGNVLVEPDRTFHVIDWDCLAVGDPVIDYATMILSLATLRNDGDWRALPITSGENEQFSARMEIYRRAIMLDWAIDVLADWTECSIIPPEHRQTIRERSERLHGEFLGVYLRSGWGNL